jgi:hypothetical protein
VVACLGTKTLDPADDTSDTEVIEDDTGPVDTGEPLGGFLTGTATTEDGSPVVGARVSLCATVCRVADTDASGGYLFEGMEGISYALDVIPTDETLATVLVILTTTHEEERALDFVVPALSTAQDIPQSVTELELTDGMFVSLGFDVLDMGFSQATTTAGVQVAEASWPYLELEGTAKAVWYLAPFDVEAAEDTAGEHVPLDFRIANTWGWDAGATFEAWEASYIGLAWNKVGTVEVSADASELTLTEGNGLTVLSTLVLLDTTSQ